MHRIFKFVLALALLTLGVSSAGYTAQGITGRSNIDVVMKLPRIVDPIPGAVGRGAAGNRPVGSIVGKVRDRRRPT